MDSGGEGSSTSHHDSEHRTEEGPAGLYRGDATSAGEDAMAKLHPVYLQPTCLHDQETGEGYCYKTYH